ncbi:MAG TPA: tRNA lysidine(34) synthetase TilS, partial [Planctomycetaceae bacterium]|nr:tRNA lysidine(34) synthetase TilS [Planctomycetaceae bacterium]
MNNSDFRHLLSLAAERLGFSGRFVLVGVSGGADSVALLRGLVELRASLGVRVRAAHLNHRLRGAASAADAEWVERLCHSLEVPVTIGSADVAIVSANTGRGLEEVARDERYRFLEKTARESGCPYIAVAHTADDQAETILHHILRGTGLAGLSGMPETRVLEGKAQLVRPLLTLRRIDVLTWLQHLGQDFREDESNSDEAFTRNRLRRRLLPDLVRDFNPQLIDALCRLGQQAAETQSVVAACADELLDRALESATPNECRLKWQPLADRPRHLVREVLTRLWRRQGWPRQRMSFEQWDKLAGIVVEGGAGDFPQGVHARRTGRLC